MQQAFVAVSLLLVAVVVALDEPAGVDHAGTPGSWDAWTESSLLQRFDRDQDGRLSADERSALRAAFGGRDVPMLPSQPHRYVLSDVSYQEHCRELDNAPSDNPVTDAGATLGRVLFYDRQLSQNNTIACASCHHQSQGFADPRQFSIGFDGRKTTRNAMGLANVRYSNLHGARPGFFWDERAETLESQVLMPIQDAVEMGMTLPELEQKLQQLPYYPPLFQAAFGSPQVSSDRIAKAVSQFMRSMISFDAKFDRAALAVNSQNYAEDFAGFTPLENLGKSLFINGVDGIGEMGCAHCHVPPTFNMPQSFNNGLDAEYKDPGLGARDVPPNDPFTPGNHGKFKAPSLRNVAVTGPYMHDGRFTTLEQVLNHYSSGVHPHENLGLIFAQPPATDDATSGFQLTDRQKAALIAFLKTLTDEAFLADPRYSDPFVRADSN